ncbi:MAG: tRNA (adenosine(37)-N6)-threonylcarbamoyltransferase complex dimerization subunit type 1 TsaB [Acidobacteria bacterium]|nr:tRNA (adenosine(37)-N6)-threonylcarbamoyltransferase complex dimerization subunit type 1 TsaB [Acidobacteriota bacterium]
MPEPINPIEPIILAVDTTAPQASYALYAGERELARRVTAADVPHSHAFFSEIESLLKQANLTMNELDALAAVTGPGSFTGLRVALAAVQGFAQTLHISAWGLNTLDAVALAAGVTGRVLVLLEAGRGECYAGLRDIQSDGSFTQPRADAVAPLETLLPEFFTEGLFVTGSAAMKLALPPDQRTENSPLAPVIAAYVARALQNGLTAERHPLQACYIRPPDAKLKPNA